LVSTFWRPPLWPDHTRPGYWFHLSVVRWASETGFSNNPPFWPGAGGYRPSITNSRTIERSLFTDLPDWALQFLLELGYPQGRIEAAIPEARNAEESIRNVLVDAEGATLRFGFQFRGVFFQQINFTKQSKRIFDFYLWDFVHQSEVFWIGHILTAK
jgi:hypothetical protein